MNLEGNIAIYGAGGIGKIMSQVLEKINRKAVCFIDKNKSDTFINNIPVYSLKNINKYKIDIVIIGIFSYPKECDLENIEKTLRNYGIDNIISFEEFYQDFYNYFDKDNFYWLAPPKYFEKKIDK